MMTVKEAMNKKYRKIVEMPRIEAYAHYREKPRGYVTINYALDHNVIPKYEMDIHPYIMTTPKKGTYSISTDTCTIYWYVKWTDLRAMTDNEIEEYKEIRKSQEDYFSNKYNKKISFEDINNSPRYNDSNIIDVNDSNIIDVNDSNIIDVDYKELD